MKITFKGREILSIERTPKAKKSDFVYNNCTFGVPKVVTVEVTRAKESMPNDFRKNLIDHISVVTGFDKSTIELVLVTADDYILGKE